MRLTFLLKDQWGSFAFCSFILKNSKRKFINAKKFTYICNYTYYKLYIYNLHMCITSKEWTLFGAEVVYVIINLPFLIES